MSQLVPFADYFEESEDFSFLTMFEFDTVDKKAELPSLDGLNSYAPTRTTSTVTPSRLTTIEQTYPDLPPGSLYRTEDGILHGGFRPPSVATQANCFGMISPPMYEDVPLHIPLHVSPGPSSCGDSSSSPGSQPPRRRNVGGRRPKKEHNLSPEEETRRKQRRERNKMAAARCRKRRLDHTNKLQAETDDLEHVKQSLVQEIEALETSCRNLEYVLNSHRPQCKLSLRNDAQEVKIKVEEDDFLEDQRVLKKQVMLTDAAVPRPERPTSLAVPARPSRLIRSAHSTNPDIGVEITTPSTGVRFNFDSIMEGGTGLTPLQPTRHEVVGTPDQRNNSLVSL